jgi:hypothetical protein
MTTYPTADGKHWDYPVAYLKCGYVGSNFRHDTGSFDAQNMWKRDRSIRNLAASRGDIKTVDAGRKESDQHLTWADLGCGDLSLMEYLRSAKFVDDYGLHMTGLCRF